MTKTCSHIKSTKSIRIPQTFRFGIGCTKYHRRIHVYKLRITSFKCIFQTELEEKIERSVYNKRRRNLFPYIEKIRKILSSEFSDFTQVFIIDSTPIEICKISRAKRSKICSTQEIRPNFGYCSAQKTKYFGYKLHAVCDKNGIFHSFDFSPANIHDVNYLKDIKYNFKNCLLIGDI